MQVRQPRIAASTADSDRSPSATSRATTTALRVPTIALGYLTARGSRVVHTPCSEKSRPTFRCNRAGDTCKLRTQRIQCATPRRAPTASSCRCPYCCPYPRLILLLHVACIHVTTSFMPPVVRVNAIAYPTFPCGSAFPEDGRIVGVQPHYISLHYRFGRTRVSATRTGARAHVRTGPAAGARPTIPALA